MDRGFTAIKHSLMVAFAKRYSRTIRALVGSISVVNWVMGLRWALLDLTKSLTDNAMLLPDPF